MTVDPLAVWWTHPCQVERFLGTGAQGDTYAAATTELGAVDDSPRLVRAADGSEVVSSTRVFLPSSTAYVPNGSRVTLPVTFGTPARRSFVITSIVHSGGGLPTPDHVELSLQ